MGLLYLVGLASLAAITSTDANSPIVTSSVQSPKVSNWSSSTSVVSTTRFLRTSDTDDEESEERAGLSVPASEKLKSWFMSSNVNPRQLQKWLNEGKSGETVFTRMHLTNVGSLLFYDPQFKTWLQYVDDLNAKTYQKRTPAISVLTTQYGDDALYKMIEDAKMIPRMKELASKLQADQMDHWVAVAKDPDEVFHLFKLDKLGKTRMKLFSSPDFAAWAKYMDDLSMNNPEKARPMISTLRQHYRDVDLLTMAESVKSVEATKSIATRLETEVIKDWAVSRKTPDKALRDLDLDNADTLLKDPLFNFWAKYVDVYNARYPEEKMTMIKTLTQKFDDNNVAKMINAAKANDATKDIAAKLEMAQLQMWLHDRRSVDDVLVRLWIHTTENDFLGNPLLNTWVAYMNTVITENPTKVSSIFSVLETRYSDKALLQILEVAKGFPSMKNTATKMQKKKIQAIFARWELPSKAFGLLGLDRIGDNILSTPLFRRWMHYVEVFNKKNPDRQESWIDPIRFNYGWSGVEGAIKQAMKNPKSVNIAKQAESAWLDTWLDAAKPPEDAFRFLHLDNVFENSLSSPKFATWAKYLDDFNKRYSEQKTTMIDGLRANYNDRWLLRIFDAAKSDLNTEKLAANLQNALVDTWLAAKKKPADLKRMLNGVPTSDQMIERYVKKFDALLENS
ncbi:hypothetical protein F442_13024 [Phytophthora nicotianae P10297]|uniref:RxLR effector protein n=6 Tax=Phytophthora nicotianae TaxID=4792 RepID=W2YWJ9_PHYNI|nr:hypothetical protein F442_13024 [Phytophthora nicotianae P10297]